MTRPYEAPRMTDYDTEAAAVRYATAMVRLGQSAEEATKAFDAFSRAVWRIGPLTPPAAPPS